MIVNYLEFVWDNVFTINGKLLGVSVDNFFTIDSKLLGVYVAVTPLRPKEMGKLFSPRQRAKALRPTVLRKRA